MLKSEHRLPKGVRLASPRVFKTDHFFIKAAKNNTESCRIAISVSKKIDKRAVIRNRIKRQISACIQEQEKVKALPALDILIGLRRNTVDKTILCQEIEKALATIQVTYPS